jgi:hypothetical protein
VSAPTISPLPALPTFPPGPGLPDQPGVFIPQFLAFLNGLRTFRDEADALGAYLDSLGVGGGGSIAATRTALATVPAASGLAYLSEAGREGWFQFSAANLFAACTVDTTQAINVPPTGQNGSAGAWVRVARDVLKPEWFGAKGDWVGVPGSLTGTGTDDLAAFLAMLAWIAFENRNGYSGTYPDAMGARRILLTSAAYYKSDTIDLKMTAQWVGFGSGQGGGFSTRIVTAASKCHFRVQRFDTVGTGGATTATTGAGGTIFDGICFEGLGGTADLLSAGIWMRDRATIRNCRFMACAGPAILAKGDTAGTGSDYGNCNGFVIDTVRVEGCGYHGIHNEGGDANAGAIRGVIDIADCARYGFDLRGFLGSGAYDIQVASSGVNGAGRQNQTSTVTDGSYRYRLKDGQDASGAGTAPTSGASNAVWEVTGAGGVHPFYPLYSTYTGAYVSGGAAFIRGTNARTAMLNGYNEGDCAPIIVQAPSFALGGLMSPTDPSVPYAYADSNNSSAIVCTTGFGKVWTDPITSEIISSGVGGAALGSTVKQLTWAYHSTYAPSYWRTMFGVGGYRNEDLWTAYANSAMAECLTGPSTQEQFGTGVAQPYYRFILNFAFGQPGLARRMDYVAAVPASGLHARGEIAWNNAPSSGGAMGWVCTATGTPGTWVAFGIAGGAQAATSSATYAAPSGGTTVDTQARASLAQLAADLADMKSKLQTGKLMA